MKPFDTAYPDSIFLGRMIHAARSVEPATVVRFPLMALLAVTLSKPLFSSEPLAVTVRPLRFIMPFVLMTLAALSVRLLFTTKVCDPVAAPKVSA